MTARPLQGLRILVTRAEGQARTLADRLRGLGAQVEEVPTIAIRPPRSFSRLDAALHDLNSYDWLLLTSANGVDAMFARLAQLSLPPELPQALQLCAIGPATRAALEQNGARVHLVPQRYVAESVVESLREKVRGKRVLLLRASMARNVIPRELRAAGAKVDVVAAYETIVPLHSRERLRQGLTGATSPQIITFTSSSTVRNLVALAGGRARAGKLLTSAALASIGPITSATLREFGFEPAMEAAEFTVDGLVAAIVAAAARVRSR